MSDYAQVTMRLPGPLKGLLDAVCGLTGLPAWRVVEHALAAYVRALPPEERRVLDGIQQRRARPE